MKVVRTIAGLRVELAGERTADRSVGFVPTMGALHDGHISLVRAARSAADVVVVSIFVNPLQFGPNEDFMTYPRDQKADLKVLADEEVSIVFLPEVDEMHPPNTATSVEVGEIGEILEGASRPGHFSGVATIVTKLFNVVRPDVAFFGQKDAQQLAVIRRVVDDLSIPVEVRSCPTVRDDDGLALSSRNARLNPQDRAQASALFAALSAGGRVLTDEQSVPAAEKTMAEVLRSRRLEPDYATVVDPGTFRPFAGVGVAALLAVAARVGPVRLIDNLLIDIRPAED
jgi:pantoate--beta-alanine ligase